MANFFSLQDGNLTDASAYGYSLANADITTNTTGISLPTSNLYSNNYTSDGSTLTALAINLSSRAATPTGTLGLTIQRSANPLTFIDNSSSNYSITTNGSAFQVPISPFNPNGWSALFDGTGHLEVTTANTLNLSTVPFTIEGWFYPTANVANTYYIIICKAPGSGTTGTFEIFHRNGSIFIDLAYISSPNWDVRELNFGTYNLNQWNHFCVTRNGNTVRCYLNGSENNSVTLTKGLLYKPTDAFGIGGRPGAYLRYIGYISNIRVLSGTASYSGTPSAPLTKINNTALLMLENYNGFTDKSNNAYVTNLSSANVYMKAFSPFTQTTILDNRYGGSGYFGDNTAITLPYITLPTTYTIEFWWYPLEARGYVFAGHAQYSIVLGWQDTNTFGLGSYGYTGNEWTTTSTTNKPILNQWNHIALVQNGTNTNSCVLYINGNSTGHYSTGLTQGDQIYGFGAPGNLDYSKDTVGYISNVRILSGTAAYLTSTFTPPTAALTNIPNTIVLLNTSNMGVQASATETYAISSFTSYNNSNSFLQATPQNWQILKLTNSLSSKNTDYINYSLKTSSANQLSLVGGGLTAIDATGNNSVPIGTTSPTITYSSLFTSDSYAHSFNGTSDSYIIPSNPSLALGTNDFTIEGWIYPTSVTGSSKLIYSTRTALGDNGSNVFCIFLNSTTGIIQLFSSGSNILGTATQAVTLNTWQHFAFTRNNGYARVYLNGVTSCAGSLPNNYTISKAGIGANNLGTTEFFSGLIHNLRVINGIALYTGSSFTPPSSPLTNIFGTVFLLKGGSTYNQALLKNNVLTPTSSDTIHIGGALKGLTIEPRTITATTSTFQNLYIHNQGTLNFPLTSSKTLTINGSNGIQITGDGTLNIGTSSSVIPLSTTHTIILNNTQIDVNNGGTLNTYGYPRKFTTNLVNDAVVPSRTFTTTDEISSIWNIGDSIAFRPNLTNKTNFDVLILSSFNSGNVFTTTANSSYLHLSSYPTVAGVYNLSRNVIIRGSSTSNRGTVRTLSAAKTNINYTQFSNFGINTTNKNALILGNTISGSNTLNGNSFIGDTNYINDNILFYNNLIQSNCYNNTITNNILYKPLNGLKINSINNIANTNINDNYILNSSGNGLQVLSSSGTISLSNNITVGSVGYGTILANSNLSGTFGAGTDYNSGTGMLLSSSSFKNSIFQGGSINSGKDGVYIDTSTINLSSLQFQNIVASNNSGIGFRLSGTNMAYTNPIYLNINGLTASNNTNEGAYINSASINLSGLKLQNVLTNNNGSVGFKLSGNNTTYSNYLSTNIDNFTSSNNTNVGLEIYNVIGTFNSLTLNNNTGGGIKTSLGNEFTTFNGITSLIPSSNTTAMNITSSFSYGQVVIKNALLSASPVNGVGLNLNTDKIEEFRLENSSISAKTPLQMSSTRGKIEGSYMFHNCNSDSYGLSSIAINQYQTNILTETGLSVMSENGLSAKHYKYLYAGKLSLDNTLAYEGNKISEKLEPYSTTVKMRSSSKFIPMDTGNTINISVYIFKSTSPLYSGDAPRLIVKRNASLGYADAVLATSTGPAGTWELLTGYLPASLNAGLVEVYIDCAGSIGSGTINIDNWNFY